MYNFEKTIAAGRSSELLPGLGHIRGRVLDIDRKGVPWCRVWIRETGKSVYSDFAGNFVMINIIPAFYTIIVDCDGYSPSVFPDLSIEAGDNSGHFFTLHALTDSPRIYSSRPDAMAVPA